MPKGGANKLGRAGNDDRRPERYPARGIKGTANKQCDLRDDTRQKANIVGPSRRQVRVKPRGASRKGPNRLLATYYAERLAFHTQLNPPNRRMRTRMYGGVGGEDCPSYPDGAGLLLGKRLSRYAPRNENFVLVVFVKQRF